MNATRMVRVFVTAGAACAALTAVPSRALAQCYFTSIPANPVSSFFNYLTAYDTVRSRILLAEFSASASARLYAWSGSSWTPLNASGPRRLNSAMAFDAGRDRLVIYGGIDSQSINTLPPEVWEWDGSGWTIIPAGKGFFGRSRHSMVYDATLGRVVMFGGVGGGASGDDTWSWNGASWENHFSAVRPPPRTNASLTFDSARGRLLLFGGATTVGGVGLDDFWEWDHASWVQRASGPPVSAAPITFDPVRARTFIVGGNAAPGVQAWEYEGVSGIWTPLVQFGPGVGTPNRALFDPALGIVFPSGLGLIRWNYNGWVIPPWVSGHPTGGSYAVGTTVVVAVEAAGGAPFAYQWQKNGVPLSDGGNVSGAQTSLLVISQLTAADAGTYRVVVTNPCGNATSNPASISVGATCNGTCYANCDGSTGCPRLTANDMMCFLNAWVASASYANCDGVGGLTGGDWQCFLDKFVAGCS